MVENWRMFITASSMVWNLFTFSNSVISSGFLLNATVLYPLTLVVLLYHNREILQEKTAGLLPRSLFLTHAVAWLVCDQTWIVSYVQWDIDETQCCETYHISFIIPSSNVWQGVFSITAILSTNSPFLPFLDHQYLSSDHDRLFQWTVSQLFQSLKFFKFSLQCSQNTELYLWPKR